MTTRKYSNGEITIVWKPDKCIHSGICVKMLPEVYNPNERPWIKIENATTEELINQVSKCPSGALSIIKNSDLIRFDFEDDGKKGKFALYEDEVFAGEMTFTWAGNDKFIIDHTGVEKEFGGKGYAKKLVQKAIGFAREKQLKIMPLCPFAKSVFDRNEEYRDVLM